MMSDAITNHKVVTIGETCGHLYLKTVQTMKLVRNTKTRLRRFYSGKAAELKLLEKVFDE